MNLTEFNERNAYLRINQLKETVELLNTTTNVSTFFTRYDFAFTICDDLKLLEGCKNIKGSPDEQKQLLYDQMPDAINAFIIRSFTKAYDNAQELKTDRGKRNRMIKFFNDLLVDFSEYGSKYITQSHIDKIKELIIDCGLEDDIVINLTPVIPSFPEFSPSHIPATHNIPITENIKADIKMMCPHCNATFINHTICPDCGQPLLTASEYNLQVNDNQETAQKKSYTKSALICFLLGFFFFYAHLYLLGAIFILMALIMFIAT